MSLEMAFQRKIRKRDQTIIKFGFVGQIKLFIDLQTVDLKKCEDQ